jgi:hypothetical protein
VVHPGHQLRPILTRAVADLAPEDLQAAAEIDERGRHIAHYASTLDPQPPKDQPPDNGDPPY